MSDSFPSSRRINIIFFLCQNELNIIFARERDEMMMMMIKEEKHHFHKYLYVFDCLYDCMSMNYTELTSFHFLIAFCIHIHMYTRSFIINHVGF